MSVKKRIVFLRTNPVDPDPRVEKETHTLSKAGFDVHILCWDRFGTSKPKEKRDAVQIQRVILHAAFGRGLQNFPVLLRWQWKEFVWLVQNRNAIDVLHACDFDTVIPALVLSFFCGKIVVYDIFDFYADHLRSTPRWIKGLIRWVDKKCIGWADGIILADDSRWEQIKGSKPKQKVIIYNTPPDYTLDLKNQKREMNSHLSLAYVGLLQVERGLFEILEILKKHQDWTLDLAGFGGDEEEILRMGEKIPNVKWHGKVPYKQALDLCNQADILFATYDPAITNHRYASPNKIFEAMMLGKPIVVASGTNMDGIIEKYECGLVIDYGDIQGIEDALTRVSSDIAFRKRLGENARRAYEDVFNWSAMESRLLHFYKSLPIKNNS